MCMILLLIYLGCILFSLFLLYYSFIHLILMTFINLIQQTIIHLKIKLKYIKMALKSNL